VILSRICQLCALIFCVIILWYDLKSFKGTRKLAASNKKFKLLDGALCASLAGFVVYSVFAGGTGSFFGVRRHGETPQMKQFGPTSSILELSGQPESKRASRSIDREPIVSTLHPRMRSGSVDNV
jgi:hypothetical protein